MARAVFEDLGTVKESSYLCDEIAVVEQQHQVGLLDESSRSQRFLDECDFTHIEEYYTNEVKQEIIKKEIGPNVKIASCK